MAIRDLPSPSFRTMLALVCVLSAAAAFAPSCQAQYKADHAPGFVGLSSGTMAPPGIYVGNLVYVYPTDTVKDNNGNKVLSGLSITTVLDGIEASFVSNKKILGANYGTTFVLTFVKNEIQLNSLAASTNGALSDTIYSPIALGWHFKRADATLGYNIYFPTGYYNSPDNDNSGLGMYGNEPYFGSTVYLNAKRTWTAAATFSAEFNSSKRGQDITVGDTGTIEGGIGKTFYKKVAGPIPLITNLGVAGYTQFKMTHDSGSDIPLFLRGYKDSVSAIGPEFNMFIPKPRLTVLVRYEPEFDAYNRTQGQTIIFTVAWMGKSLIKMPPHP